jgi:hypothetical protein
LAIVNREIAALLAHKMYRDKGPLGLSPHSAWHSIVSRAFVFLRIAASRNLASPNIIIIIPGSKGSIQTCTNQPTIFCLIYEKSWSAVTGIKVI